MRVLQFQRYKRSGLSDVSISREEVGEVYRQFKAWGKWDRGSAELSYAFYEKLSFVKVLLAVEVLTELGFLHIDDNEHIIFAGSAKRVELSESPTFTHVGVKEAEEA
jgi:hypothetical protein